MKYLFKRHSLAIFIHFTHEGNKYFQSGRSLVNVRCLTTGNLVVKPEHSYYAYMSSPQLTLNKKINTILILRVFQGLW